MLIRSIYALANVIKNVYQLENSILEMIEICKKLFLQYCFNQNSVVAVIILSATSHVTDATNDLG